METASAEERLQHLEIVVGELRGRTKALEAAVLMLMTPQQLRTLVCDVVAQLTPEQREALRQALSTGDPDGAAGR